MAAYIVLASHLLWRNEFLFALSHLVIFVGPGCLRADAMTSSKKLCCC